MLTVISPAKSLDFRSKVKTKKYSSPQFITEASALVKNLRQLSPAQLSSLMGISDKLAQENFQRFNEWKAPFSLENARQAIFAFKGDVYLGLKAEQFSTADLNFAQKHLRILSGLYGVLKPLDLMQAYRLEMGRQLSIKKSKNLYEFWGSKITLSLKADLKELPKKSQYLINLASNEYFSSIHSEKVEAKIITPQFKDWSNGKYRIVSFFAKKARGEMAAYIIKNKISSPKKLIEFDINGYRFCNKESTDQTLVYKRKNT